MERVACKGNKLRNTHGNFEDFVFSRVETCHFTVNPDERASWEVERSHGHGLVRWTGSSTKPRPRMQQSMTGKREQWSHAERKRRDQLDHTHAAAFLTLTSIVLWISISCFSLRGSSRNHCQSYILDLRLALKSGLQHFYRDPARWFAGMDASRISRLSLRSRRWTSWCASEDPV